MMGSDIRLGRETESGLSLQGRRLLTRRQGLLNCTAALMAVAWHGFAGAATTAPASAPTLLVVGDSLSAEYGIGLGTGWVALLAQRLAQQARSGAAKPWRVVNASVSGDTTSGGRSRLPGLLAKEKPAVVILELGGNDALRGLPLESTRDNLAEMTRAARAAGARVVLAGMQMPPNYGRRYAQDFARLFAAVAQAERAALVPFLLAGVADAPQADALFQPDRIHPVARAHPLILANVWPVLEPVLQAAEKGAAPSRQR